MPTYCKGNMWPELEVAAAFCVTTNSTLAGPSEARYVVMGKGIAAECAKRFPDAPRRFGEIVESLGAERGEYGLISYPIEYNGRPLRLVAFQVKYHWRDNADYELIRRSTERLDRIARKSPHSRFVLNFPGIGNGRLDRNGVADILRILPANVYIYEL